MRRSAALVASGAVLIGTAALVSNAAIERSLLGEATGALRWGPTLLRSVLAAQGLALLLAGLIPGTRAPRVTAQPPCFDRRSWIAVVVLTVIALALRLWRLDSGMWLDEVFTLTDFVRAPLGRIVTSFPSQNQHMLFSVLAHASIGFFGESVWALRLPAALFGAASVWALFLLGRRILHEREALLACAVLTVSYHHVWFSQNARGYSALMFFATLATWLWLEASARDSWPWWFAYAVAVALGTWSHLTMLFVAAAHAIIFFAAVIARGSVRVEELWRPIAAWLLAGSLILELHALALPEFLSAGLHEVSLPSQWTNPLWLVLESWRSLRMAFGMGAAALLGLVLAGTGWLGIMRRDWTAGLALVLPALLGGGVMLAAGHNLWPRFFFFSMGFALLIAVHGAMRLPQLAARRAPWRVPERLADAAGIALAALIVVASAVSLPRAFALPKQDFTGARDYIESVRQPDDAVVAVGLAGLVFHRYFAPDWPVPQTGAQLEALRQSHRRVWLVYTLPIELEAYRRDLWNIVQTEFQVVRIFPGTLGGGEVMVCRERSAQDGAAPR